MAYYINTSASYDSLQRDIKELIPAPDIRRRMSHALKMGVATAMEAIGMLPGGEEAGAIITATGLGCLADSEKFLRNMITGGETLLNPTPFIQSTFNTVGAQVALLTGNHGYNMTYVHGGRSFESALLDAMIRLDEGARHVLAGAFDETTPAKHRIMERMGAWRHAADGEGAWFFVLSAEPLDGCIARLVTLDFPAEPMCDGALLAQYGAEGVRTRVMRSEPPEGMFHTASARTLREAALAAAAEGGRVIAYNDLFDEGPTVMVVECIRQRS